MITEPEVSRAPDGEHTPGRPSNRPSAHVAGLRAFSGRSAYVRYLAIIGVIYVVLFGWLMVTTNGMPYVMDNNESFSSLTHAMNIVHFGVSKSVGLTDEAYGPNPDAHPFVYTHQGNFPRIFALLIYLLGAHSIQAQIIVTTFTAGAFGVFLMFEFFSRRVAPVFAFVVSLILLSDYLLFTQWQVVTYRVWHAIFLFGALLCVEGLGSRRPRTWAALTVLTYACMFYFEFIFVAFVSVLTGLYAAYRYRRRLRRLLVTWGAMGVGAVIGIGVLLGQLLAYVGWDGFKEDVFLTYFARNEAGDESALLAELHSFYSSHNIVFWYNLIDSTDLRTPAAFLRMLFTWSFQVYTPLLSLVVLILLAGWVVAHAALPMEMLARRVGWRRAPHGLSTLAAVCASGVLVLAVYVLVIGVLGSDAYSGVRPTTDGLPWAAGWLGTVAAVLLGCVAAALVWVAAGFSANRVPAGRVVLAAVLTFGVAWCLPRQWALYNQTWRILWQGQLESQLPESVARSLVLVAVGLSGALIVGGPRRALSTQSHRMLRACSVYLACAFAAYTITYLLSPGYVYSGYLVRFAPMPVFITDVTLAFAAVLVVGFVARAWSYLRRAGRHQSYATASGSTSATAHGIRALAVCGVVAGCAALFVSSVFWLQIQHTYLGLLPPDHNAFLQQLADPPYAGASFAVNNYAAPEAMFTGQWAYFDPKIQSGQVTLTDSGYVLGRDMDSYLWLADKRTNPDYLEPTYFACVVQQDLGAVVDRLTNPGLPGFCPRLGVPGQPPVSVNGDTTGPSTGWTPKTEIVARDPGPDGWWEIMKLDWSFPPYLAALSDASAGVRVKVSLKAQPSTPIVATPVFDARQQDGVAMQPPLIRLYRADDQPCELAETYDPAGFTLPPNFTGPIRLSVTPRTAEAIGTEFSSDPVYVGMWFSLPNTRTGGAQEVQAASLEQAEEIAQAAGTWTPGAGTFGQLSEGEAAPSVNWAGYTCQPDLSSMLPGE